MPSPTIEIRPLTVGPVRTNCYVVCREGRDDCAVIDPGDQPERIRQVCAGRRIAAILLTHGHFDHIAAVRALCEGAEIIIHELDACMLTDARKNAGAGFYMPVTAPEATRTVREGDTVEAAGLSFRVLHTPGHTPGSVCYELEDVLFTGDTLFADGCGRTDLWGGNSEDMQASLRRLAALRAGRRILPGHGGFA